MICPNCSEDAPEGAKWCEACGQDLGAEPLPACVSCGEREVGADGYCGTCGWKQPEERDHLIFVEWPVTAVTDRGKRHRRNEDAVAIGVGGRGQAVMVVCDGVSSAPGSAEASLRAATSARDLLVAGLTDDVVDRATLLGRAAEAAQGEASMSPEVESSAHYSEGGPPSSTFVAVVATPVESGVELATAWIGDSRAYWVGAEPDRLTEDHEIDGSLIRWLGADSLHPIPEIRTTTHDGRGHVVVCTDGLWRYADAADDLSELLDRLVADGAKGSTLASALVDFANDSGGHDNISVALWTNDPDLREPEEPTSSEDPVEPEEPTSSEDPVGPEQPPARAGTEAPQGEADGTIGGPSPGGDRTDDRADDGPTDRVDEEEGSEST